MLLDEYLFVFSVHVEINTTDSQRKLVFSIGFCWMPNCFSIVMDDRYLYNSFSTKVFLPFFTNMKNFVNARVLKL